MIRGLSPIPFRHRRLKKTLQNRDRHPSPPQPSRSEASRARRKCHCAAPVAPCDVTPNPSPTSTPLPPHLRTSLALSAKSLAYADARLQWLFHHHRPAQEKRMPRLATPSAGDTAEHTGRVRLARASCPGSCIGDFFLSIPRHSSCYVSLALGLRVTAKNHGSRGVFFSDPVCLGWA